MLIGWLFALSLLVAWLLWRSLQHSSELLARSDQRLLQQDSTDDNQQELRLLRAELAELRSGVIGVGQRVLELESQLQSQQQLLTEQAEQLQAVQLIEPESKIYSRAMKMVQLGADLEEIMRECELPRAEAELLFNLHQQKS
ncbi:DUF2802 domain-containing protein [Alkalimonas amylolytica]|uniref:DUF2802 domain-containing protein n=1 Tax=Alkalimonas amylolytica TaxID=152573 RepID=A0A1H4BLK5_ALKAM|nr:DUF2802 domain-containing protein [Alkalimonas amylolytica]SEA48986.1 Protein of unknown function [Alkalimonas amylolytica]